MSNWPAGRAPDFRSELFFSLTRGLPVSATFTYRSSARTEIVKTKIVSYEPPPAESAKAEEHGK